MLSWLKKNPKRKVAAGAVILGTVGTATGYIPLQVLSDVLANLAPLLGG